MLAVPELVKKARLRIRRSGSRSCFEWRLQASGHN